MKYLIPVFLFFSLVVNAQSACNNAEVEYVKGSYVKAIDLYKRCLQGEGDFLEAYYSRKLALCYLKAWENDSAAVYINRANELDKDGLDDIDVMIELQIAIGDFTGAINTIRKYGEEEIPGEYYLSMLLDSAYGVYNNDEWDYVLNYALAKYPKSGYLLEYKGRTFLWREQYTQAKDYALALLASNNKFFIAYDILGEALYELNEDSLAYLALKKAASKFNNADIFYKKGLANHYLSKPDYKEIIADANRAIALKYDEPNLCYFLRGSAYAKLGNYTAAISDFEKDLALDPTHYYAYYDLAEIYCNMNDKVNAKRYVELSIASRVEEGDDCRDVLALKKRIEAMP